MNTPPEISNPKQLRQFGLIMAGMITLFFGLLIPWIWGIALPLWPWIVAGVFVAFALTAPGLLKSVYQVWMKIGHVLGWINTRLILSMVFFLIFVPVGLVMRLARDPMRRKLHEPTETYRIESKQPVAENLERPL